MMPDGALGVDEIQRPVVAFPPEGQLEVGGRPPTVGDSPLRFGVEWIELPIWDDAEFCGNWGRLRSTALPISFGIWLKHVAPYHRRGKVVVSVTTSARVDSLVAPDGFAQADEVILTSESQRPLWAARPAREGTAHLLGGYSLFPSAGNAKPAGDKFRLLLMGNTERDHGCGPDSSKLPKAGGDSDRLP